VAFSVNKPWPIHNHASDIAFHSRYKMNSLERKCLGNGTDSPEEPRHAMAVEIPCALALKMQSQ
jgi:hypothetical protein